MCRLLLPLQPAATQASPPPPNTTHAHARCRHPLNFRNQVKKYDAEMKFLSDKKARETALAEFQAEQEKMQVWAGCVGRGLVAVCRAPHGA